MVPTIARGILHGAELGSPFSGDEMGATAMKLENVTSGAAQLLKICSWRSVWDFDAPGISQRVQLERLHYAILQARRLCRGQECDAELEFAQNDCEALLSLPELEGEQAESERVPVRMARIRRVVTYHEGQIARLNRCFWWIPFTIALIILLACCVPCLLAMVEEM